jgi:hypothetical protein
VPEDVVGCEVEVGVVEADDAGDAYTVVLLVRSLKCKVR